MDFLRYMNTFSLTTLQKREGGLLDGGLPKVCVYYSVLLLKV
jgi:hypothetical protein